MESRTDIVERLRGNSSPHYELMREAADEIERLRAALAAEREANANLAREMDFPDAYGSSDGYFVEGWESAARTSPPLFGLEQPTELPYSARQTQEVAMELASDAFFGMTAAGVITVIGFALGVLWGSRDDKR